VNDYFFSGIMEKPNLVWNNSSTKLGSYDYGSDTISITSMLRDSGKEMLDYVMYHEILHKKYKFISKSGRLYHHTKEFKSSEKIFPDSREIEQKLRALRPRQRKTVQRKRSWLFRLF
jgi:predicted metal-dependent hydrolase